MTEEHGVKKNDEGEGNPHWRIAYENVEGAELRSGINGAALHLGKDAASRKPIARSNPLQDHNGDFTISFWVSGEQLQGLGARSYGMVSALSWDQEHERGWEIGVQPNGSWYWRASDADRYSYEPTWERQPLQDGDWHHLSMTYAAQHEEVRLYYDGASVAIYSVPLLRHSHRVDVIDIPDSNEASTKAAWHQAATMWIGGKPHRTADGEEALEREAFPGTIDELWMENRVLSAAEIESQYRRHQHALSPARAAQDNRMVARLANDDAAHQRLNHECTIKVMTFNIWNGGREMGAEIGVARVIDVIRDSGADIIAMQETYGSGPIIADALGYYFYLRSSNLSIMSRFPMEETYPFYEPFHSGGVKIQLSEGKYVNVFSIWLHYLADYWGELFREKDVELEHMLAGEAERIKELNAIMKALEPLAARSNEEPLLLCGDFNSSSHLDWTEETRDLHNGYTFPFPQSIALHEEGYRDTYREVHQDPALDPCITWPAWEPEDCIGDRIDFIYAHGDRVQIKQADSIRSHAVRYPSDHAAVIVQLKLNESLIK